MKPTDNIKTLLSDISIIRNRYELAAKLSGENFNIFNITGISKKENALHSNLICELLNPDGSHDKGTLFLKLFLDNLGILDTFDLTNAQVIKELFIGFKNEDNTEGGRIDIVIKNFHKQAILIENKIDAEDQEKQLFRYFQYGKKHYEYFDLYYLTLHGKEASENSISGLTANESLKLNEDYRAISYKKSNYSGSIIKSVSLLLVIFLGNAN